MVWGDDRLRLREAREAIRTFLGHELGLTPKAEPYLNRCAIGMDFLGCRVFPTHRTLDRRGRARFRRKLRHLEGAFLEWQIDETTLQRRATGLVAFARAAGAASWRWRGRAVGSSMVDDHGLEPRGPRRVLEHQRQELPIGEPRQEHVRGPEQQPGVPRGRSSADAADAGPDWTGRAPVPIASPSRANDETGRPVPIAPAGARGGLHRPGKCANIISPADSVGIGRPGTIPDFLGRVADGDFLVRLLDLSRERSEQA